MIIECKFLSYDADDFRKNRVAYNDDPYNAPSILTPGAVDFSDVSSIRQDEDSLLGKKSGELTYICMKSGLSHVVDIPTHKALEYLRKSRTKGLQLLNGN